MESTDVQTAIIQRKELSHTMGKLPLTITNGQAIPSLPTPYHVRIRVHAAGLNPTDHKMVTHFFMDGKPVGCDFAGVIDATGENVSSPMLPGTRVCGAEFPYRPNNQANGAFQQWIVADSRQLLRVPEAWSFTEAAALGAIGWGTACLALWGQANLNLKGLPSRPTTEPLPVLVYGGATATGLIAIQLLRLSGHLPIAVCSPASSPLCLKYGATGTVPYTSEHCVEEIKLLLKDRPMKHVLDCITSAESTAICFASLSRVGGRYACLEDCPDAWRTRKAVKVSIVMGFEIQGVEIDVGHPTYSRMGTQLSFDAGVAWAAEIQTLLDTGRIVTKPTQEISGGLDGILLALEKMSRGDLGGRKLVVNLLEG